MGELFSVPRRCMTAIAMVLLAGCAGLPRQVPAESAECRALFQQVDRAVEQQGVRDHGPALVAGFPYLRTSRFLASFRDEVDDVERFAAWSRHMAALDAQARRFELGNLATPVAGMDDAALANKLDACREQLIATELAQPGMQQRLRAAAQVPDAYAGWWRAAGLYPITAPLVMSRVKQWHHETHNVFATPLHKLPVAGSLQRWRATPGATLEREQIKELLGRETDPLGLPVLAPQELQLLFDTFAPVWEVDMVSDDDRIGMPYWSRKNELAVNIGDPQVYRLVSHTRFNGHVLLQLNYIVWFPARPGDDIYAGMLDGINWRVTLGPDGAPWLYDAMHNCGCYYQVFPSDRLDLRDTEAAYAEPALQPQVAPGGQPLVIRIAAATHYIQRIYLADHLEHQITMSWSDYDALRALPAPGGTRSLFGEHGIVEQSRRPERFLLWPMGVRSPGAMRQWGQHAIAFIGRRHFDDAHLLDTLFESVSPP